VALIHDRCLVSLPAPASPFPVWHGTFHRYRQIPLPVKHFNNLGRLPLLSDLSDKSLTGKWDLFSSQKAARWLRAGHGRLRFISGWLRSSPRSSRKNGSPLLPLPLSPSIRLFNAPSARRRPKFPVETQKRAGLRPAPTLILPETLRLFRPTEPLGGFRGVQVKRSFRSSSRERR